MKSFQEFITEGRDAPLYHGTRYYFIREILDEDVLNASTSTGIIPRNNNMDSGRSEKTWHGSYRTGSLRKAGVSLTRSLQTAFSWVGKEMGVVLELDQAKLIHNKKLSPMNIQGYLHSKSSSKDEYLFEERVLGPIKPLSRYLTKIMIWELDRFKGNTLDTISLSSSLYKHPLLYDAAVKKFVNQ